MASWLLRVGPRLIGPTVSFVLYKINADSPAKFPSLKAAAFARFRRGIFVAIFIANEYQFPMGIIENPTLRAFQKIADLGSVHAAANVLNLTQTAVTKRIQALERELGLTLFIRSRRGMSLTEDGILLRQHCRALDELEGSLRSRLSGHQRREVSLTVLGPTSAISTRIVENCAPLYALYPSLQLHLCSDDHADRVDLVRRGIADFAIVSPEKIPNEMESKRLKPDRYLLVASAQWKGRKLLEILERERIIDFYSNDPTTTNYLQKFDLAGRVKKARLFVNENAALVHLFRSGIGFGTLTETVARPHLEAETLIALNKGLVMEDPLALIWYPRTHRPDYFSDLIRHVR